jgi:hypothetical protein
MSSASSTAGSLPAGWYGDPEREEGQRYWDGAQWSEYRTPHAPSAPPGLYPDPSGAEGWRSWDGARWTESPSAADTKAAQKREVREELKQHKEARRAARVEQRSEQTAARADQRAAREAAAAEAAFLGTPQGRARTARQNGQRFFQILLPVENVDRTWLAKLSHEMHTRTRDSGDLVGQILTSIEDEGWQLVEAGFAFRQTGQASRDKFLASGQQVAVMGDTVGVYLFRAR